MIEAVLFDLDDTLYPEEEYRRSGLTHLAGILGNPDHVLRLLEAFDHHRGHPVHDVITLMLVEYRNHKPNISPHPEVVSVLEGLRKNYHLGLVTDDPAGTQLRKVDALGIAGCFDHVMAAQPPHLKPTRRPYLSMTEALSVDPRHTVFVGSHPATDLYGARRLGMQCVRITRGNNHHQTANGELGFECNAVIGSLSELPQAIERIACTSAAR